MHNIVSPPSSATPGYVVLAGVVGAVLAAVFIALPWINSLAGSIILLIACGLPMWWLEMRRFPVSVSIGELAIEPWRKKIRLLGVLVILFLFFAINLIVSYALTLFARPDVLGDMELVLVAFGGAWGLWILLRKKYDVKIDSLDLVGISAILFFCKNRKLQKWHRQTILGWCVKAYFLPLMLGGCYFFVAETKSQLKYSSINFGVLFTSIFYLLYAIDTAFATIGYCSTSRRINAHIRSTDATFQGWIVTLVCYAPLNLIVLNQWLSYRDDYDWRAWLIGSPLLLTAWGALILLLTAGYVWSTVSFGLRFSNLSYRGLISTGPYRYFKHPSYFFKNISWWLISIPFVSQQGGVVAIENCLGLLGINCIYVLRAWTEERHLASDPDYRTYSAWMAEFGIFGRFRRLIGC